MRMPVYGLFIWEYLFSIVGCPAAASHMKAKYRAAVLAFAAEDVGRLWIFSADG